MGKKLNQHEIETIRLSFICRKEILAELELTRETVASSLQKVKILEHEVEKIPRLEAKIDRLESLANAQRYIALPGVITFGF